MPKHGGGDRRVHSSFAGTDVKMTSEIVRRLETVAPDTPIESLLPIFDRGLVAIVCEDERFLGLITRFDVLSYLRRQMRG